MDKIDWGLLNSWPENTLEYVADKYGINKAEIKHHLEVFYIV